MPDWRRPERDFFPPPSAPRPVKDGLRAKSKRGAIGETWWSQRFIAVLERFHDGPRLVRGRAYARRGQVMDMDVGTGEITARVQGSRARPYRVRIGVKVLGDADWGRVEEAMASQAVFLARLLAGEMPPEIEDVFAAAGLSLFPTSSRSLQTECSCPDSGNPCKHIAAVYYLLAEAFDRDPFLIFAWRGRPRERLLTELRALRGVGAGTSAPGAIDEPDAALRVQADGLFGFAALDEADLTAEITEEQACRFWEPAGDLASVHVKPRATALPDAILRELGPSGLSAAGRPIEDLLAPAYRTIAAAALRLAAGGEPEDAASAQPSRQAPAAPRPRRAADRAGCKREGGSSRELLERLIEEATVDCYGEPEERTGFHTMIAAHLEVPFVTTVLGVVVTVTAVELTTRDEIVAVCRRGRDRLAVSLLELALPAPRPRGAEWIEAYRLWSRAA